MPSHTSAAAAVLVVPVVWLGVALLGVGAALPAQPSSRCQRECGGVDIPYPFGIVGSGLPDDDNCAMPGFGLTCDETGINGGRRRPFYYDVEVVSVSLQQGQARMQNHISSYCYNATTQGMDFEVRWSNFTGTPYRFADTNKFTVIGCLTLAYILGEHADEYTSGCVAMCRQGGDGDVRSALTNGSCSGIGCCQTAIPRGLQYYEVGFDSGFNTTEIHNVSRCSYAVLMDASDFTVSTTYATSPGFNSTFAGKVPLAVDWVVGEETCDAAHKDPSSYACVSDHSECFDSLNGPGYICNCSKGYQGNPYLQDPEQGCKDINECTDLAEYPCSVPGTCQNLPGGFECRCPQHTKGDAQNGTCETQKKLGIGIIIGIGVGSAAGFLLLVLTAIFVAQRFKHKRQIMLKQNFFKQNRGQLLQQLVSPSADIAERMIIPVDELAKATNNFDKAREIGRGGHGTVYKGILSDLHVVAIKKSKITVQKEIDEFINEVAILSQINHRNIVKLLGCCLETEVPLLVYEFICSGTLYDHLHVEGPTSLSWVTRLRIATEIASAFAYLHSSVSIPIIHRDIKSSNILLDETMTSKVSDFGASRYIPMDKTGLTTMVQGTIGYLDPMYFYTGRLIEKSDVYSFGVILVELLTRKKPFSYSFLDGDGLVSHFVKLLAEQMLVQILDRQVIEEGGKEVHEVSILAPSCMKLNAKDRPTMRQVEHTLDGLLVSKKLVQNNGSRENLWE